MTRIRHAGGLAAVQREQRLARRGLSGACRCWMLGQQVFDVMILDVGHPPALNCAPPGHAPIRRYLYCFDRQVDRPASGWKIRALDDSCGFSPREVRAARRAPYRRAAFDAVSRHWYWTFHPRRRSAGFDTPLMR